MKLVRENLFEISQGKYNGLGSIGIGKIALIKKWLAEKGIENYTIKNDNTIDINGDLVFAKLAHENLISPIIEFLPDYIQFATIYGNFDISGCSLLHLRGCPIKVTESFDCSINELNSLDFCPKYVGGEFVCYNNIDEFTENDVKSRCNVGRGIYTTEKKYYGQSADYNQVVSNAIKNM